MLIIYRLLHKRTSLHCTGSKLLLTPLTNHLLTINSFNWSLQLVSREQSQLLESCSFNFPLRANFRPPAYTHLLLNHNVAVAIISAHFNDPSSQLFCPGCPVRHRMVDMLSFTISTFTCSYALPLSFWLLVWLTVQKNLDHCVYIKPVAAVGI